MAIAWYCAHNNTTLCAYFIPFTFSTHSPTTIFRRFRSCEACVVCGKFKLTFLDIPTQSNLSRVLLQQLLLSISPHNLGVTQRNIESEERLCLCVGWHDSLPREMQGKRKVVWVRTSYASILVKTGSLCIRYQSSRGTRTRSSKRKTTIGLNDENPLEVFL